jgi:hypothetical protein
MSATIPFSDDGVGRSAFVSDPFESTSVIAAAAADETVGDDVAAR